MQGTKSNMFGLMVIDFLSGLVIVVGAMVGLTLVGALLAKFTKLGEPKEDAEEDSVDQFIVLDTGKMACPECLCDDILEGPSAGCATNVVCAKCLNRYNAVGVVIIERQGLLPIASLPKEYKKKYHNG